MRGFAFSATVAPMRRLSLALSLLAGCTSPQYQALLEEHADDVGTEDVSSGDGQFATTGDTSPASTGPTGSDSAGAVVQGLDGRRDADAAQIARTDHIVAVMGAEQIDALATLPTREEALSRLMSVMQGPIAKLARTINEVPSKLVRTLAAVNDQKREAA